MTVRTSRRVRWAALTLGLVGLLGVVACSGDEPATDPSDRVRVAQPEDAIDEPLMLALLQAKNFHHQAKVYMTDGNTAEALAAVRKILTVPFPDGAPESEDVRLDARALLAKLLVGQRSLDEAMKVVGEGLAGASRDSFFVANLHTVKGEIYRAMAEDLDALGTADAAARARELRKAAIAAWTRSNEISEPLQQRLYDNIKQERR